MSKPAMKLAIAATHPVPYHAPLFREVQRQGLPVTVIYGSDFSLRGYFDRDFATTIAWDSDLESGYEAVYLTRVAEGGAADYDEVRAQGLQAALARCGATALLVMGYQHRFDLAAIRAGRRLGLPVYLRAETNDAALDRGWWKSRLRDLRLRLLYRKISGFLYIGTLSWRHYERLQQPSAQLWFSPYGADTSVFEQDSTAAAARREQVRADLGISPAQVFVVCSGKLILKKGQDLLLEALALMTPTERAALALGFMGDGPERTRLEARAAALPDLKVHFLGFRNQRQLTSIYCAADLAVQYSREGETWGVVVNEALAHGLPVVVSDRVGCAVDLIVPDRTGQIVPAENPAVLVAALRRELARLPQHDPGACRSRFERYSLQRAAQGVIAAVHGRRQCEPARPVSMRPGARPPSRALNLVMVGGVGGTAVGQSLARAAQRLGHRIEYVDQGVAGSRWRWLRVLNWHWRDRRPPFLHRAAELIVDRCERSGADALLTTGAAPVTTEALVRLRARGVATINYSTDDPWNTRVSGGWYREALAHYAFVYTPRTANLDEIQALGSVQVQRLAFAYDDELFYPEGEGPATDPEFDVVFVGGGDVDRVRLLTPLLGSGLRVGLFGDYWHQYPETKAHACGGLTVAGLRHLRKRTAVSLCLVRRQNRDGHVMRSFEAAACGECMLVERTPEHEAIFGADGECVRYFDRPEDIASMVRELLADPAERWRLSQAVHARIAQGQRYIDRLAHMLDELEAARR